MYYFGIKYNKNQRKFDESWVKFKLGNGISTLFDEKHSFQYIF